MAKVYLICGSDEKGKSIINHYLNIGLTNIEQYAIVDLTTLAPYLKNPENIKLIKDILIAISHDKFKSGYWEEKCIEALELINDSDSKALLKEMAKKNVISNHRILIERVLRSLNNIITPDDEDWYIEFIKNNNNLKGFDLRRAIEGLGIIGSAKSLPLIKEYFNKYIENTFIKDTCYWSYQNILRMNGDYVVLREDILLN